MYIYAGVEEFLVERSAGTDLDAERYSHENWDDYDDEDDGNGTSSNTDATPNQLLGSYTSSWEPRTEVALDGSGAVYAEVHYVNAPYFASLHLTLPHLPFRCLTTAGRALR